MPGCKVGEGFLPFAEPLLAHVVQVWKFFCPVLWSFHPIATAKHLCRHNFWGKLCSISPARRLHVHLRSFRCQEEKIRCIELLSRLQLKYIFRINVVHEWIKYTLWHTTNAICCFSAKKLVTWVRLLTKMIFFVVLWIATAYNQLEITICKQP